MRHVSTYRRSRKGSGARDNVFLKLFMADQTDVTQEEVDYFKQRPDEIDEITAPLNIHLFFLGVGIVLGIGLVALSKFLKYMAVFQFAGDFVQDLLVDVVFEIGVALVGAGVTSYLLGVLLNLQQENAAVWKQNIRNAISVSNSENEPPHP